MYGISEEAWLTSFRVRRAESLSNDSVGSNTLTEKHAF